MQLEKYKEALMNYNYAIELNNSDPVFYSNRALCYFKMEKYIFLIFLRYIFFLFFYLFVCYSYENCIDDCNAALKIDSKYVKAYYRRMQANECLGNNNQAFEDCSKVLEFQPDNVDAKRSLERIQKRLNNNNKLSESKTTLVTKNLKNESENAKEQNEKSMLNMNIQALVKTEEIKQNEQSEEESVNVNASTSNKSLPEIEKKMDMKDQKTKANAYKDQGNDCVKKGHYDEAIMFYTMAIEAYDLNAIFFCNRAFCHLKLKRFNHCIVDCNIAIKLDCNLVKAYFRRMLAYESLNDCTAALLDCNTVLKLEPKNLEAKQCLQRINLSKFLAFCTVPED